MKRKIMMGGALMLLFLSLGACSTKQSKDENEHSKTSTEKERVEIKTEPYKKEEIEQAEKQIKGFIKEFNSYSFDEPISERLKRIDRYVTKTVYEQLKDEYEQEENKYEFSEGMEVISKAEDIEVYEGDFGYVVSYKTKLDMTDSNEKPVSFYAYILLDEQLKIKEFIPSVVMSE